MRRAAYFPPNNLWIQGNVTMPPKDSLYFYTAFHFYSFSDNRCQVNEQEIFSLPVGHKLFDLEHLQIFPTWREFQVFCWENLEIDVTSQSVLEIYDAY